MSCRRVRRELLDQLRFGTVDRRSSASIDHLVGCPSCREEIGIDQALVRQLRRALLARVEGAAPSPRAWEAIRARALAEESVQGHGVPSRAGWFTRFGRLSLQGSALRALATAGALAVMVFVTGGRLAGLTGASPLAAAPARPTSLVQTASLPVLEPWRMDLGLGIAPPLRPSGLTEDADAVGAVVAAIPAVPQPTASGFFR
jgi:hypothetical protein